MVLRQSTHPDELSAEAFENASIGLIRVDPSGMILAYNRAESRMSGRTPESVLGRSFFTEVAPCTNSPSFYGRFLARAKSGDLDVRFEFDFNFGIQPTRVVVRLLSSQKYPGDTWIMVEPLHLILHSASEQALRIVEDKARLQAEVDTTVCAQEPIHQPAAIQPHGALVVVDPDLLEVVQASTNLAEVIGLDPDDLIRRSIRSVFPNEIFAATERVLGELEQHSVAVTEFEVESRCIHLRGHRHGAYLFLEFLYAYPQDTKPAPEVLLTLEQAIAELVLCSSPKDLDERFLNLCREFIPVDRLLIYQFQEDWTGVVRAELLSTRSTHSYLGVRFPESDIPRQARALYERALYRAVPNMEYTPIPLSPPLDPHSGENTDLSHCHLRSVSPIHREYNRRAGVAASLSASILRDGKLWGLVLGHHGVPYSFSLEQRTRLSSLVPVYSATRLRLEKKKSAKALAWKCQFFEQMVAKAELAEDKVAALFESPNSIQDLFEISGAALLLENRLETIGRVPDPKVLHSISRFLDKTQTDPIESWTSLVAVYPRAAEWTEIVSGLTSVRVGRDHGDYLLLFLPEYPQEVHWGLTPTSTTSGERGFQHACSPLTGHSRDWPDWTQPIAERCQAYVNSAVSRSLREHNDLLRRAQAATTASTNLLSNVSHELRTPLAGILGAFELLEEFPLAPEISEILEEQRASADALRHALEAILDYSKSQARELVNSPVETLLSELVDEVVKRHEAQARAKGIPLSGEVNGYRGLLLLDRTKFAQALDILVRNAIQHTDRGSVTIKVHLSKSGRFVTRVIDTGRGLPPDESALWTPFRQDDAGPSRQFGGLGLGLALCRELVHCFGAQVGARSLEHGSFFWIAGKFEPIAGVEIAQPRSSLRILYVDDEPFNLRLFENRLEKLGHKVTCVATAAEALAALDSELFDIALLDIQMPQMNGIELAAAIMDDLELDLPLAALSADSMPQRIDECLRVGFTRYFTKPVTDWERLSQELGSIAARGKSLA